MGGGTLTYLRPVPNYGNRWLSSFSAHTRRTTPSKEPGVDYYCPIGTELVSIGDGRVSEIGGGTGPATGRYIKVNLDNGQSFRLLHLKGWRKRVGDRVRAGEVIAISGASGYGSEFFGAASLAGIPANTGGPHVHATLFPTWSYNNFRGLLDLELYTDKSTTASVSATPFEPAPKPLGDEMYVGSKLAKNRVYAIFSEPVTETPRARFCGPMETSYAITGDLVIWGEDVTLNGLVFDECGFNHHNTAVRDIIARVLDGREAAKITDEQIEQLAQRLPVGLSADEVKQAVSDVLNSATIKVAG